MGSSSLRGILMMGTIFILIGIIGTAYSLNKLDEQKNDQPFQMGGFIGLLSTPVGMISALFFMGGLMVIVMGLEKILKEKLNPV